MILVRIFGNPVNNFGKNRRMVNIDYNLGKNLGCGNLGYGNRDNKRGKIFDLVFILGKNVGYGNLAYNLNNNLGKNLRFKNLGYDRSW